MSIAFYGAMLIGVGIMSYATFWMEKTFGVEASFERCLTFISFTATPMFFVGLVGLFPVLWLNVLVVLCAISYSLYLLYVGVPIYMDIPEGKGFMFSSSILTVGLCTLVGCMGATIIIWSSVEFKRHKTTILPHKASSAIINSGPFKYSRNPIYFAFSMIQIGAAVLLANLWILLLIVPAFLIMEKFVIEREEAFLSQEFGEPYNDYKKHVRRWI